MSTYTWTAFVNSNVSINTLKMYNREHFDPITIAFVRKLCRRNLTRSKKTGKSAAACRAYGEIRFKVWEGNLTPSVRRDVRGWLMIDSRSSWQTCMVRLEGKNRRVAVSTPRRDKSTRKRPLYNMSSDITRLRPFYLLTRKKTQHDCSPWKYIQVFLIVF